MDVMTISGDRLRAPGKMLRPDAQALSVRSYGAFALWQTSGSVARAHYKRHDSQAQHDPGEGCGFISDVEEWVRWMTATCRKRFPRCDMEPTILQLGARALSDHSLTLELSAWGMESWGGCRSFTSYSADLRRLASIGAITYVPSRTDEASTVRLLPPMIEKDQVYRTAEPIRLAVLGGAARLRDVRYVAGHEPGWIDEDGRKRRGARVGYGRSVAIIAELIRQGVTGVRELATRSGLHLSTVYRNLKAARDAADQQIRNVAKGSYGSGEDEDKGEGLEGLEHLSRYPRVQRIMAQWGVRGRIEDTEHLDRWQKQRLRRLIRMAYARDRYRMEDEHGDSPAKRARSGMKSWCDGRKAAYLSRAEAISRWRAAAPSRSAAQRQRNDDVLDAWGTVDLIDAFDPPAPAASTPRAMSRITSVGNAVSWDDIVAMADSLA